MKRYLGFLPVGAIAVAGLVGLSIQAGCASDEDPTNPATAIAPTGKNPR